MVLFKNFLKSLIALPISSFIILIIYIFLYVFLGEKVYLIEISALQNYSILVRELLVLSLGLYIAILTFQISNKKFNNEESKLHTKVFYMIILVLLAGFLPILLVYYFLADLGLFKLTFFILWISFIAIVSLIYAIKDFINVWIINTKLRKSQSNIQKGKN